MEAESPSAKRLWLLSRPTNEGKRRARESIAESTPAEHVRNLIEAHQNDIMENIFSLSKSDGLQDGGRARTAQSRIFLNQNSMAA